MVEEIDAYISASEAARLLAVTRRRIYALVAAKRLRAERVGGRLLVRREDVERRAREAESSMDKGHPFSPRRAWALLLLAAGEPVPGIDAVTRSKLRRLLADRSLWSLRAKLAPRAERRNLRAHSSDLALIESEPGVIRTGPRAASAAGLSLIGGDAPLQFYVDENVALDLARRYAMRESRQPNVVLRVVPGEPFSWLRGPIAPALAVALDLAEDGDPRSQQVAREVLESR